MTDVLSSFTYTMPANSNRLTAWQKVGSQNYTIAYNDDGSRSAETTCPVGGNCLTPRTYTYDALGRTEYITDGFVSADCTYDPLGRLFRVCEAVSKWPRRFVLATSAF